MEISFRIKEKVTDYIVRNELITHGDTIIIGVSGGADSICLLFLLSEISKNLGIEIKVIHIEHGIRGLSSLEDAKYVKKICEDKGIDCRIIHIDAIAYAKENSLTLEEAARILRYKAFEDYRRELSGQKSVKIAVAHHVNDQAETVIFQMLRGSGIKGMGGMSPQRDNIIRPLLSLSREEILLYLSENHISYRTDESNKDNSYSRNYLRNDIIPRLTKIQPQAEAHISEMAAELRDIEEFMSKLSMPVYERAVTVLDNGKEVRLNLTELTNEDEVLIRTVLRMAVSECVMNRKDISRAHFNAITELIKKGSGKSIDLPKGITVIKQGECLIFKRKADIEDESDTAREIDFAIDLNDLFTEPKRIFTDDEQEVVLKAFNRQEGYVIPRNAYTKCFDYDKISNGLHLRNARIGDYLIIDDKGHKKAVKDYFVNEKIPINQRDRVLLLAEGNHVLWILGYRISEQAKITDKTTRILEISITGGFPWEKK